MPLWPDSFGGTMGTFCPSRAAEFTEAPEDGCGNAKSDAWPGGGEPCPPPPFPEIGLGPAAGSLDRAFFPDAVLARFRHREDGDEEHHCRNDDRVREGP